MTIWILQLKYTLSMILLKNLKLKNPRGDLSDVHETMDIWLALYNTYTLGFNNLSEKKVTKLTIPTLEDFEWKTWKLYVA